jgi:hypothetical protein
MKVSDAIKQLQKNYSPEDELIIEWWDRDLFHIVDSDYCDDRPVSNDVWEIAVKQYELNGIKEIDYANIYDSIQNTIDDVNYLIKDQKGDE